MLRLGNLLHDLTDSGAHGTTASPTRELTARHMSHSHGTIEINIVYAANVEVADSASSSAEVHEKEKPDGLSITLR